MDDPDDGDWCSINEAARRLHVTPTAIRNRIKRGTLKTKPHGNHGRLVRVPLPVTLTVREPVTLPVPEPVALTVPDPLVPELRAQITQLEVRLGAKEEELLARSKEAAVLEAVLAAERTHADELRRDRDRWAVQAHALAHPPVLAAPERRGFLGWIRKWA